MKPCFGYTRVSTVKQGDGVSLQEQKDAIQAFAARNDLTVVQWFEEKETAAKCGRPVFNKMLRHLRRGNASGLIMHKIDRSARNLRDWAIVSELPDQGIDVFIATESLDFSSRGGRLTADMLAVIAADFIRNQREETKKGLRGRLKQGLYPFRAPIGYLDNGRGKAKTPCPVKAPLIKEMFDLYASRQHSLRSLQKEITRQGLRNLNGQPLTLRGVATILSNPFYTGTISIKRTGEVYPGSHEAIVSPALFRRVQDVKAGRCGPKVTRHNHLFRGLFRCGLCGAPMSPERQKGRVYYRCQVPDCATKTVREDILDASISRQLVRYQLSSDDAEMLHEQWSSAHAGIPQEDLRKPIELQISATEKGLSRAADLLIDGTLDEATYLAKKRDAVLKLAELKDQLAKTPNPDEIVNHHMKFLELAKSLTRLYENLKPPEKRVFIENTFSNRTVVGRKPVLEPYPWLEEAKTVCAVPFGDPHYHTDRIYIGDNDNKPLQKVLKLLKQDRPKDNLAA